MPEVVNVRNFLLSIRETGYRSFAHTIAELIDNSLQAGATHVSVSIGPTDGGSITVTDNGKGMTRDALETALQFGGSTRYGDRTGAGRFGMGLPTSSVSLAKRVDVYTWDSQTALHAYLCQ
jgi:signal transduction histidine kinase